MNPIVKAYAHAVLNRDDPLEGVPAAVRRAVLIMPTTLGERLRLAPWTSPFKRRAIMREIVAERLIRYELAYGVLSDRGLGRLHRAPSQTALGRVEPNLSPFWAERLAQHQAVVSELAQFRRRDDLERLQRDEDARRLDAELRAVRAAWLKREIAERERELEALEPETPAPSVVRMR